MDYKLRVSVIETVIRKIMSYSLFVVVACCCTRIKCATISIRTVFRPTILARYLEPSSSGGIKKVRSISSSGGNPGSVRLVVQRFSKVKS